MGLLYKIEKKLTQRVEREIEETEKDMEFAAEMLNENEDVARPVLRFFSGSKWFKLLVLLSAGLGVYLAWKSFSMKQLTSLAYIIVGLLTAKVSDYGFRNWEFWFTTVLWLPAVLYGLLPGRVRMEK